MEQIERIKQAQEQLKAQAKHDQEYRDLLASLSETRQTILRSFSILTDYLDEKVTKTEVINPTTSVSTPDIANVVKSVTELSEVVKQSQPDFAPIVDKLSALETQLSQIPKEHPELPEQKEDVKVTNLSDIDFSALEEAIKGIKLEQTDLKPVSEGLKTVVQAVQAVKLPELNTLPLEKSIKAVESAVKAIKIDIPKTDLGGVEKRLDKSNKLLKEIADKPVGGSGGGGSSWTAINEQGIAQPLQLQNDGLLTTDTPLASRIDDQTPILYIGKAPVGSATSAAVWQISKIDTSAISETWAGGAQFNQVWDNRGSLTYE